MPRLLLRNGAFSSFTWTTVFYLMLIVPLAFFGTSTNAEVVEEDDWGSIIGIDLGTTYSSVGVMQNGTIEILVNDQGKRLTPSYVAFTDEERLIGDAAKDQYAVNPHRTIFGIKRLIGRKFDDKDVQKDAKAFPFKVVNKDGKPYVNVDVNNSSKNLTPEEVSAMVLGKMKDIAEGYLGKKVTHAVVTAPAYFNDAQRQATKDAGTIAGLNVLHVLKEPIAAAIAYGLDNMGEDDQERLIIVYDLGGGTFDVSLLSVEDGVFEVWATAGDAHLGGEDFDHRLMDYFIKQYNNRNNVDVTKDLKAMDKLKREVEKAKRTLSSQMSTRIEIEAFYNGRDFSETLTRAEFEDLNIDLFKKTLKPVEQVLKDANVKKSAVDHIILAGGSTRIPKVQSLVEGFFGGKKASNGINPDEAVAFGAAILGDVAYRPDVSCHLPIMDLNPLTLGIETTGGVMTKFIPSNFAIPFSKSRIFSTTADNQSTILVQVFEGERSMTKDNNLLGKFELTGIPPAPCGVPQIEVSFNLDANGILKVSASDKATSKEELITIANDKGRLTPEEIERMVMEAEEFAEEDKSIKAEIEAEIEAHNRNGLGCQIDGDDKQAFLDAVKVTDWLGDKVTIASAEDFEAENFEEPEEQLPSVAYLITSKLYDSAPEDDETLDHREL